ncbi:hypothetical protein BBJ28_00006659, partial [Nothophytophthora sp. Chile5]
MIKSNLVLAVKSPFEASMVTSLPSEPLAAYAVGMLRKLARISLSADQDDATAAKAVDDTLRQAQQLLGDGDVPRVSRERFVDMLEDAVDWSHVQLLVDALAASREAFRPAEGEQEDATKLEESAPAVLEVLACAICCGDLMLKPATLPCGHSFCKACVELWLRSCPNCPTCRHPVAAPLSNQVAVNRVLQDLVATLYPKQTQQLEQRGQLDRLNRLHDLIQQCLDRADGGRLQDALTLERLRNGGSSQDQSVAVAMVLEQDAELRSRVMAAEIRERM